MVSVRESINFRSSLDSVSSLNAVRKFYLMTSPQIALLDRAIEFGENVLMVFLRCHNCHH